MKTDSYDAIIVGAGFGGSSCAALLAKRGLKVLLVDKNAVAGGKAISVSAHGFTHNLWIVCCSPATNNSFDAVLKEIGKEDKISFSLAKELQFVHEQPDGRIETQILDTSKQIGPEQLFGWLEGNEKQKEQAAKFMMDVATISTEDINALDDVTFAEFLSRYEISKQAYAFLTTCFVDPALLLPADVLSASEAVYTLKANFTKGFGIECPGGLGKLAELFAEAVEENGGTVMMSTKVDKIVVKDGRVVGVATDKGYFKAPIVVSNAGIQPTVLKLVGEEHFDKGYVNYTKDLVMGVGWMGCRYFLSNKVMSPEILMIFSDNDMLTSNKLFHAKKEDGSPNVAALVAISNSNYCPSDAPEGKQIIMVGYPCPKDPSDMTRADAEAYNAVQEARLFKVLPEMQKFIERKEISTTRDVMNVSRDYAIPGQGGECIGLGQTVRQSGKYKPPVVAPIRGLFYVGTDAGGRGVGTMQATDSGINVANIVQQYFIMHPITK